MICTIPTYTHLNFSFKYIQQTGSQMSLNKSTAKQLILGHKNMGPEVKGGHFDFLEIKSQSSFMQF